MPDLIAAPHTPDPGVEVTKFDFDWAVGSDPGHLTEGRLDLLGDALRRGAWFLNPIYLIHAPAATVAFYRAARRARASWRDQVRGSLNNLGFRSEARRAERDGRRHALLSLGRLDVLGPDAAPSRPSGLPPGERREVHHSGHLARQMAFTGLMIIGGEDVAPRVWNRTADELLGPERSSRRSKRRRLADPAVRPTNNPEPRSAVADLPQPPAGGA